MKWGPMQGVPGVMKDVGAGRGDRCPLTVVSGRPAVSTGAVTHTLTVY